MRDLAWVRICATAASMGVAWSGCKEGNDGVASSDAGPPLKPEFVQTARTIAGEYLSWGRVDDELRWAPGLCRIPLPGVARPSRSTDPATHGNKLYSVFVKQRDAYPSGPHIGQVVVKQSWTAERVTGPDAGYAPESYRPAGNVTDHFYPYARDDDGGIFRASAPAGLYIMFRLDPTTPDTDGGWVYATLLPDGRVTAAGPVSSCMRCHEDAPHDRLFGVPKGAN